MGCFVTRNGVPESGRCAAPASETGTPRWVESSVSAQAPTARASTRTDPRLTNERITELLETDRARRGTARPKGSGFSPGCEPGLRPEPEVGADAEHAVCGPVVELFRVVGDVDPDRADADVAPDHPPEVDLVVRSARRHVGIMVVPDPGRDERLDAHDGRGERDAQPYGGVEHGLQRQRGRSRRDLEAVTAAEWQVAGDGDAAAADQPEPDRPAHGEQSLADEVGVPGGHSTRQREDAGTQRDAAAECGASARITVGPAVIAVDGETSPGCGVVPHGLAQPLCRGWCRQQSQCECQRCALHSVLSTPGENRVGTRAHGPGGGGATVRNAARPVNPERFGGSRFGYMPSGRCKSRCAPTPNTPRFPPPFSLSLS